MSRRSWAAARDWCAGLPTVWLLVINVLGFQLAWWACVVGRSAGLPLAVALLAWSVWLAPKPARAVALLLACTLIGLACDGLLLGSHLLRLVDVPACDVTRPGQWLQVGCRPAAAPRPGLVLLLAPPWMAVLWPLLGSTLNHSMAWLQRRPVLAALLGAAGGLASYEAGARLGAVEMVDPTTCRIVIAAAWAVLMPGLLALAARLR
jgi:hypothetical protein